MSDNNLIIYQPQNALSALQVRIENDTVWLTQKTCLTTEFHRGNHRDTQSFFEQ